MEIMYVLFNMPDGLTLTKWVYFGSCSTSITKGEPHHMHKQWHMCEIKLAAMSIYAPFA